MQFYKWDLGIKMKLNRPVIISLLNQKGGSGKTTIATNLAHGLSLRKNPQGNPYKVLLIDSDPQGSTRDWGQFNAGKLIPIIGLDRETLDSDIKSIQEIFDFIVIDGAPSLSRLAASAIKASHCVLIPIQPSPYDIWSANELVEAIKTRQAFNAGFPLCFFVISRMIKNTKLSKDVIDALSELKIPVFKSFTSQFVAYPTSAIKGDSVYSFKDKSSMKEIESIIDELFIELGVNINEQ